MALRSKDVSSWADENRLTPERQWGIISQAKSKSEDLFLSLGFKKVTRSRLVFKDGRVERKEEESTEPEIGEFHLRKDGLLELYSCGAKQRGMILHSLSESLGKDSLQQLYLSKESMTKLMKDAIEILSISFTGLGNPFFSDATLTGADPVNSKTCKELLSLGEIKSFRAKFAIDSSGGEDSSDVLLATVYSNCRIRVFSGQKVQAQSDIEEFVTNLKGLAAPVPSSEET